MKLKHYAVYKADGSNWTEDEIRLIAISMGDISPFSIQGISGKKYIYMSRFKNKVRPYFNQNIEGKTLIEFNEYKKMITSIDNLKVGDKVLITDTWMPGANQNPDGEMDIYLGKIVTVTHLDDYNGSTFSIEEDRGNWTWYPSTIKCIIDTDENSPIIKEQEKQEIKKEEIMETVDKIHAVNALLGLLGGTNKPRSKKGYLSLRIKNSQANVQTLIHQAFFSGLVDPREYVQDLISRELNRLTAELSTINLENIKYGFNIKLASQVSYFTRIKTELNKSLEIMDLEKAVNFYRFKKEVESYSKLREANNGICPFNWIANHLNPALLDKRGIHTLFKSNKINITLHDGELSIAVKDEALYKTTVKLTVATNVYYI